MTDNKLTQLLEQLHTELNNAEALDDKGRELLRHLSADIETLLTRTEGGKPDESVLERLQDSVDHFEESHPTLTAALSSLLTALNNAGI